MPSRRAAMLGVAAALAVWLWQFLTVHYNYAGNWTALFNIASHMPVPPFLKSERLYIFQGAEGYDGQIYHLIAHDPWMRRGSAEAISGAAFRYQRILVPALAWMIALGEDARIHAAYFAVMLGFVFLGVYWMALLASRAGLAPAWGLVFLLTPATITSVDRMTVDVALAALTVGFVLYLEAGSRWRTIAVLVCAALTRETAWAIIAGYALYLFTRRRIFEGAWTAATTIPAAAWFVYLSQRTEPSAVPSYLTWIPLAGIAERVFHPVVYSLPPLKNVFATAFDYVALAGIAMTLVIAARLALRRQWDAVTSAIFALGIAAVFVQSRGVWEDAYAFGRVLTPLLLLVAIQGLGRRPWLALVPMLLVDSRISLNLAAQVLGVARGLAGI